MLVRPSETQRGTRHCEELVQTLSENERDGRVFVGKSLVDYKTEIVSSKTVAVAQRNRRLGCNSKVSSAILTFHIDMEIPPETRKILENREIRIGFDGFASKQVFSSYNFEEITFTRTNMLRNGVTHGELEERGERGEWN